MTDNQPGGERRPWTIAFPVGQDVAAGFFLIFIGLFFFWQSNDLPMGTLRAVGPGMLPRAVSVMIIVGGGILVAMGWRTREIRLPFFSLRGMFFIIGGILVFGFLIRTVGLVAAGPLAMIFASYASEETKLAETAIFSIVMTAFCVFLFKYLLGLPIPIIVNYW
ncbi:MAG: tripartite tricarboxylate transporter TctB family protein [Alphaproteobacteria bacterium]|nr:tripartite tricarboxylate transporter TctB family protein [Alphaproteobacteria bacterium]